MPVLRSIVKIGINHFGYDVRRVATVGKLDVALTDMDPVTLEYIPTRRGHAVLDIPLADVRAFHSLGLRLDIDSHPFVRAIACAMDEVGDAEVSRAIEQVLRDYYGRVRPETAADVLGVSWEQIPGLRGYAPNSPNHPIDVNAVPWGGRAPAEVKEGRRRTAVFEGLQNGVLASVEDGVTSFGPVRPAKMKLEVGRLSRLLQSVRARGFQRFDARAPLQVAAFRRDGQYRWVINSGQHRFATAAAFGIERLPAMVTEVIRREDAALWPQVVSGIFTEDGATTIFDRIFDAVPAPICREWLAAINREEEPLIARR